jgi:hypothetical protein
MPFPSLMYTWCHGDIPYRSVVLRLAPLESSRLTKSLLAPNTASRSTVWPSRFGRSIFHEGVEGADSQPQMTHSPHYTAEHCRHLRFSYSGANFYYAARDWQPAPSHILPSSLGERNHRAAHSRRPGKKARSLQKRDCWF